MSKILSFLSKYWNAIKGFFQAAILWITFQKGRSYERDKSKLQEQQNALEAISEDNRREANALDLTDDERARLVELYPPRKE